MSHKISFNEIKNIGGGKINYCNCETKSIVLSLKSKNGQ